MTETSNASKDHAVDAGFARGQGVKTTELPFSQRDVERFLAHGDGYVGPAERREIIRRLLVDGVAPDVIARRLGCHETTVRRARRALVASENLAVAS